MSSAYNITLLKFDCPADVAVFMQRLAVARGLSLNKVLIEACTEYSAANGYRPGRQKRRTNPLHQETAG